MVLLSITSVCYAQERKVWEEYGSRVGSASEPTVVGSNSFGEEVDTYMGGISFKATDVDMPGNNELPVRFERRFNVRNNPIPGVFYRSFAMADWEIQLPSLSADFAPDWTVSATGEPNRRCSVASIYDARPIPIQVGTEYIRPDEYWDGVTLQLPEGGGELLHIEGNVPVPGDGETYHWTAGDNIRISCLPALANGAGEGFQAVTPNGNRYRFDWMAQDAEPALVSQTAQVVSNVAKTIERRVSRKKNHIYPTRVEDRYGNWVSYTYSNAWNQTVRLTRIDSSDGRSIAVQYDSEGNVSQVAANGRVWTYSYTNDGGRRTLTGVRQPDQTQWSIDFSGLGRASIQYVIGEPGDQNSRNCARQGEPYGPLSFSGSMVHPSGLSAQFTVGIVLHGRSNVPLYCKNVTRPFNDRTDDIAWIPPAHYGLSLVSKTLSGVGIEPMQWTYAYSTGSSYKYLAADPKFPVCPPEVLDCTAPLCTSDDCAGSKSTAITAPDGSSVRYKYGNSYRYNEGKLLDTEVRSSSGELLRKERLTYDLSLADSNYPARWGVSPRYRQAGFPSELHRPLLSKTVTQDGVNFGWTVQQFDTLARPVAVSKQSSVAGAPARIEGTQFHDNLAKWVMGQTKSLSVNGALAYETIYNAEAAPATIKEFGRVAQSIEYHADGTVSAIRDGNGNMTSFSAWKRGVPQAITFPDGASISASVEDNGWIAQSTDEGGYTTSYQYDPMGRLVRTDFAAGDSVAWNPVTAALERVNVGEYGLPPGHWRYTVETGTGRKIRYLDAMWRTLLLRELDTANAPGTERFTGYEYDHEGRNVFSSYPSASSTPDKGVWTQYDAIGRVVRRSQDSELGLLTTSTAYGSDGQGSYTLSTRPDGRSEQTWFQAFDQPSYELPREIRQPEGVITRVTRDVFNRPLSITRGAADGMGTITRSYTYDAQGRVCRQLEPETGVTLTGYDGAGNLTWSAAGLDASMGCHPTGLIAGAVESRVSRTYDSRNRLKTLLFPDGNGDQTWRYAANGKPDQIITKAKAAPDVVNAYTYTRRGLLAGETGGELEGHNWSIGYAYNANGVLSGIRYPSGMFIDYAPNGLAQPTRAGSYAVALGYHPNGGMRNFTYGNGIQHVMQQNARQLPARVQEGGALDNAYTYDGMGNVSGIQDILESRRTKTMAYDGLDRLVRAQSAGFGGDGIAMYSYDAVDNLRTAHLGGIRQFNYWYDANNRITNVRADDGATTIGLAYDSKGNLSARNGIQYRFDHGNRLREVMGVEAYRYDGHGRRVANLRPDGTGRLSLYGMDGVLRRQEDTTGRGMEYVYLNGSLIAQIVGDVVLSTPVLSLAGFSSRGDYAVGWSGSSAATSYELEERVQGGVWHGAYTGAGKSWIAPGNGSGTYDYRVRACRAGSCSTWSSQATIRVQLPPSGTSIVSAPTISSDGTYSVSWTRVTGAAHYRLEESVGGGGWSVVLQEDVASRNFTGRSAGNYGYRVFACNAGGCGAPSASVNVGVVFPPAGVATINLAGRSVDGSYTVSWSAIQGADRYTLEESANGAGWQQTYSGAAALRAFVGKMAGTYAYRVMACNAGGCGGSSSAANILVQYPPSAAPQISVPTLSINGSYTVTWTGVAAAERYLLEESANGGSWVQVQDSNIGARSFSGRPVGSYGYRVRAINGSGAGPYSASGSINVIARPSPPLLSGPAYNDANGYTFSWGPGTGGGSHDFDLEKSMNGGAWDLVSRTGSLSATAQRLESGSYAFRVKDCNAAGCSDYSNVVQLYIAPAPIPPTPAIMYSAKTERYVGTTLKVSCSVRWTVSAGATTYNLKAAPTGQVQYSGPEHDLTRAGAYYCAASHVVQACNASGCSQYSSPPFLQQSIKNPL